MMPVASLPAPRGSVMTSVHPAGRSLFTVLFLAGVLTLISRPAQISAQYGAEPQAPSFTPQAIDPDDIPAHIDIVEGVVTLEREARQDAAVENDAVLAGDRLRTERGRAEIL